MKPIRIWFNRTFSSAYHAVNLIRNNPDGCPVKVYGSHDSLDAVFLGACDRALIEPSVPTAEYLEYALDFCAGHRIRAFVPKRYMAAAAGHRGEFADRGTGVLVAGTPDALAAVSDKGRMYATVERLSPGSSPLHRVVRTVDEFRVAHAELAAAGVTVCLKPAEGEGGGGFRIISTSKTPMAALSDYPDSRVGIDTVLHALGSVESFAPLVVSEVVHGPEYSVDCLASGGRLVVGVARRKIDRRTQRIEDRPELVEVARAIAAEYGMDSIFNVQFLWGPGGPKVIDVNPRMSAGVDVIAASGVNLPWLGIRQLLDGDVVVPTPAYGVTVGRIDHLVRVDHLPAPTETAA
jgi:hypothetical protein